MPTRKAVFANNEFYHIFNRGVDKRKIILDQNDSDRFLKSILFFNSKKPIGSIYEKTFSQNKLSPLGGLTAKSDKLVNIVAYCLNPNHFHFILEQKIDGGISEFMKRLGGGYTWYFNYKYKRNGSLFQGSFKSVFADKNEYLLHLSAYINLNNRVHKLGGLTAKLARSSWNEYLNDKKCFSLCAKDIILSQFKNSEEYRRFAESSLKEISRRREEEEISKIILE